nr:hypothetical protein HmN_000296400 [Hymenolepis microstoma]
MKAIWPSPGSYRKAYFDLHLKYRKFLEITDVVAVVGPRAAVVVNPLAVAVVNPRAAVVANFKHFPGLICVQIKEVLRVLELPEKRDCDIDRLLCERERVCRDFSYHQ